MRLVGAEIVAFYNCNYAHCAAENLKTCRFLTSKIINKKCFKISGSTRIVWNSWGEGPTRLPRHGGSARPQGRQRWFRPTRSPWPQRRQGKERNRIYEFSVEIIKMCAFLFLKGKMGMPGFPGINGVPGVQGPQGSMGLPGLDGCNGTDVSKKEIPAS